MNFANAARAAGIAAFLAFAGNASASAILIDFEGEAVGAKPNGYTTAAAPGVHFSDTVAADLEVLNLQGSECNTPRCLAARPDDGSAIQIDLDFLASAISMEFGNDQPFGANNVQDAVLSVFLGGGLVGQAIVQVNNNNTMDQLIAISGPLFDRAVFQYVGANGAPATLIEVIDNVRIQVPAPAPLALLGMGLLALGVRSRARG